MTVQEIMVSEKEMLTAADIAEVIGSNPDTIRQTAKDNPYAYWPLQPVWVGNRLKFPTKRFQKWITGNLEARL